jgi:hypothetical protein
MKYRLIILILSILSIPYLSGQRLKKVPGVVINYRPSADSLYIGSPSICILPNGNYVVSHDFFGPRTRNQMSIVSFFLSKDQGYHWELISQIEGQMWSQLFMHDSLLYIIGPEKVGGDVLIRKSQDNGYTWTLPNDKNNGRILSGCYHSAPTPVIEFNGRIWKAMEDLNGPKGKWGRTFRTLMMSAPANSNLLNGDNWVTSNVLTYDSTYLNGNFGGWLEGNAVVTPQGNIVNILRTDYRVNGNEKASIIAISKDGLKATFDSQSGFIDFPGGCKKFTIRYDSVSNLYWSLSNFVPEKDKGYNPERTRNTLALLSSSNLRDWSIRTIVLHHSDVEKHGFQYADFQIDKKDLIAVVRTAFDDESGGADNQHNANYLTFHRIKNFRNCKTPNQWKSLLP